MAGLQVWQNYHKVSSLPKSLYSSPCLSSFLFCPSFVALVTWHQCNIMVNVPFIYAGNFPPYVNYMYTGRMSRFFATYEQRQTSFQFQFQFPSFQNADFISTLQFTTKTRITSGLFLIHIYIQQCPNLSLGLDHCCHA